MRPELVAGISTNDQLIEPDVFLFGPILNVERFYYKRTQLKIRAKTNAEKKFIEDLSNEEYELLFNFYLKQNKAVPTKYF